MGSSKKNVLMKSVSKLLAGLVLLGLLAVGVFSFGEKGIVSHTLQKIQEPQSTFENTNKITVAEITNEKEFPLDNSRSAVVLNTFISTPHNDLVFDHLLNAREFDGAMVFAGDEPTGIKLRVKAPVNLSSAELPEAISGHESSHRENTINHDSYNYPTMSLTARSLTPLKGNIHALKGLFTLYDVTRPVQVPVIMEIREDVIHLSGELSFLQSDYSIATYNTPSHTTQNKDKVVLKFELTACAK